MKPGNANPAKPQTFLITLEVGNPSLRGLQMLARKYFTFPFPEYYTAESVIAYHALQFALTRPNEFSKFIDSLLNYQDAEGLHPMDHGDQMVQNHPSYKKKPLPEKFLPFAV